MRYKKQIEKYFILMVVVISIIQYFMFRWIIAQFNLVPNNGVIWLIIAINLALGFAIKYAKLHKNFGFLGWAVDSFIIANYYNITFLKSFAISFLGTFISFIAGFILIFISFFILVKK